MRVHVYERLMAMQKEPTRTPERRGGRCRGAGREFVDPVVQPVLRRRQRRRPDHEDSRRRQWIADRRRLAEGRAHSASARQSSTCSPANSRASISPSWASTTRTLHNFLFRGFLKPWEAYTGASIKWIDLAQADYNARLQQSIATGTADFDIIEMGAPFEGDMGVKDLLSEMPDWVMKQIDFDDYRQLPQAAGRHLERQDPSHLIDSDCHTMNRRTDVFGDRRSRQSNGRTGRTRRVLTTWGAPKTWQQVQQVTKFLKGKKVKGKEVYGFLDQPKPWGGFQFYFTASRATAYAKYPGEKNWMFDENMKPLVNNPAWVRAIQDVVDLLPYEPADQINADPGTTAFQQFLPGTGALLEWWGDIGTVAKTSDTATIGDVLDFDILPASDDVYNFRKAQWEKLPTGPNVAPNMAYLGWGIYVMKTVDSDAKRQKAAWSAAAHLGGKDLSMWTARLSLGLPALSEEPHQPRPVGARRLRQEVHWVVHGLAVDVVQSPEFCDRAAHPGHLPVLLDRGGRAAEDVRRQAERTTGRRQRRRGLGQTDRQARAGEPGQVLSYRHGPRLSGHHCNMLRGAWRAADLIAETGIAP